MSSRTMLVAILMLVGCGVHGENTAGVSSLSAVVLTAPPDAEPSGKVGGASFGASSNGNEVLISPLGTDEYFNIVLTGEVAVMMARSHTVAGTDYLLVGAINADDEFTLYRFHDSTSDRIVDASTKTTLFTTAPDPCYLTEAATFGDDWYFLDRRTQDVRLVLDTNHDGFPNSLQSTPFALSDTYPFLIDARHLYSYESNVILASAGPMTATEVAVLAHHTYEDTDDDGIADDETTVAAVHGSPRAKGHLFDGQTAVMVRLDGAPSQEIEIWTLDEELDDVTLLGSVVPASGAWEEITLSAALVKEGRIGIRFNGAAASQRILLVGPDDPEVLDHDVDPIVVGDTTALALTGQNFTSTMSVVLETSEGTAFTLAVTYTDSEHISVALPSLQEEDTGGASLTPMGVGQGVDDPAYIYSINICTAADVGDE